MSRPVAVAAIPVVTAATSLYAARWCLPSAPARGLRVNPREWLQVVCIRFISVPFSVVCLVDGYDYTR